MADTKVSAFTGLGATPAATDILPMVDDPGGTPLTRSVTVAELMDFASDDTITFTNKTFDAAGTGNSLTNVADADIADTADVKQGTITFVISGGGSAVGTGVAGDLEIPFACTIDRQTMLLDTSSSTVLDIWKDTYANFPPTVADTITASAKPTTSAAVKDQDATLTGWTTAITAGDTLRFNVDSNDNATLITISLKYTKD